MFHLLPSTMLGDNGDLWVFGYGSLMWRPGFDYIDKRAATLVGLHRALCVYSHVHRGTPERPGLVLGLDRGGACRGLVFRVAAEKRDATIRYLREREQVTSVYLEVERAVTLRDDGARIRALTYIVDRGHKQYAGGISLEQRLHLVRQGHGQSGPNSEYVKNTVRAIEALGMRDPTLHWLAEKL